MKRLLIAAAALLISSTALATTVFPTRSVNQSRPSKLATLMSTRLPTQKALIAHCDQDFNEDGSPAINPVTGAYMYTCWYEDPFPPGDGAACMGGFVCGGSVSGSCDRLYASPYDGCSYDGYMCSSCW